MTTTQAQWAPLEKLVGDQADGFMFMGVASGPRVWPEGPRVHLYKHEVTRRYLNIDEGGGCWQYRETPSGGSYFRISTTQAIDHAFS